MEHKANRSTIRVTGPRTHAKASERYLDVVFCYPKEDVQWEGSVPIEYRRTGVDAKSEEEEGDLVLDAYEAMQPSKEKAWLEKQKNFWDESAKRKTRPFFDCLAEGGWKCTACELPKNANYARRIQEIKELGYTLATHFRACKCCGKKCNQLILLRLPRGAETGYESWSPALRKRILETLDHYDVYAATRRKHSLPDHKFPEIRWSPHAPKKLSDDMGKTEIEQRFQLMSNQRNQQKREACRTCYQTDQRQYPYGISYFYKGGEEWPTDVPKRGSDAESGCDGCGWYDLGAWRASLNDLVGVSK